MSLLENLEAIQARMVDACERAGRAPESVRLIAVSKGHPPNAIGEAVDAGLVVFGESKVQELKVKVGRCSNRIEWHMIGHLQTNKVRDAVQFSRMIQSVDSLKLAAEIDKWADRGAKSMPVLLEVNVAGEASKHGYAPDAVIDELDALNDLGHLEIHGLMTIAPFSPDPERVRVYFQKLRELKERCEDKLGAPLPELSMGMSGDFEVAIEEGATMVRVGTSLFGRRNYSKS